MHITDEVERTMFVAAVIPQRNTFDDGGFDLFDAFQHKDVPEAFPLQPFKCSPQL